MCKSRESHDKFASKVRGRPEVIWEQKEGQSFSAEDWLYLLKHRPNDAEIVRRCDKWDAFAVDEVCDLLAAHPQLAAACPDVVWQKFRGGHWARLIVADHGIGDRFVERGLMQKFAKGWCCVWHWAENYATCFKVRCAAAQSHEEKVLRIARESAINSDRVGPGCGGGLSHTNWLAAIASDCAEMASVAGERRAEEYCLVAEAANLEAQKMVGRDFS